MKLSVIVPVYNVEPYLERCMDSLINQTLEDMEILVVDDGSTDGSARIARRYEAEYPYKIKVLSKENGGLSSARNMAMNVAQGDYLGFVDSDDWVDTDMYERMYDAAVREDADIVICDMEEHYPTHTVQQIHSQFANRFRATPSVCIRIYKRSLIGEDRFPMGLWYEDLEFTTKQLMKTDKIAAIHRAMYHYDRREGSIMRNNNSRKNLDIVTVFEHLEQFAQENGWQEKYSKVMEILFIEHILLDAIKRVQQQTSPEKKEVLRKLRREVLTRYPKFYKNVEFKQLPRNHKIVALLNGAGLSAVSGLLLKIKGSIKAKKHAG